MKRLNAILFLFCLSFLFNSVNVFGQCVPAPVPNDACYQQVIANDPFCCNVSWDAICQGDYDLCNPGGGGCVAVAPVPNDACYQQVITNDPFCCDVSWDAVCQGAYDGCNPGGGGGGTGCNTDISICQPGVAGPFGWSTASNNPSSCLDFTNGAGAPNYAYIILYITQSGPLNLLIDGDQLTGCIDVSIFDITGEPDPCTALNTGTEIGCNYASNCDGCNEFGSTFPGCLSEVPAPNVNAGDVLMILIEDWSNTQSSFTLELSNAPGSAQTGPGDPTINPAGPFNDTDPPFTMTAANGGGTWSADCGACIDPNTGEFDPSVAGNGTWTVCYDLGAAPCDANDCEQVVVGCAAPQIDPLANFVGCDSYTLPVITGNNLTGNEAYFTGAGGTGTQYNAGQVITTSQTLYIYDFWNATCWDEESFTITLDVTDPVINCPGNLTAVCDISEQPAYATLAQFNTAGGTATDETSLDAASFTLLSEVSDNNSCPEVVTRTYQIADDCGHTSTCVQTITIDDNINPTGTAPANINVECAADVPAANPALITDEADNCGIQSVVHIGDVSDNNTCPETITRTYRITDLCGNFTDVTQTITVQDVTAPVFAAAPADVTVECIGDVPAMTNLNYTDNCDAPGSVAGVDGALVGGACGGTITRTWTYTDACGNVATATQTITIDDTTPPVLDPAPADVTVECVGDVPAMVNLNYTDNCDAPGSVAGIDGALVGGACGGTITRTWTYTDACGNAATATQTITIDDTTPPTASNPAQTIVPGGPAPAPDPTVVIDEADNCTANPTVAFVSQVSDNNPCPETITYTYSVTDDCGNSINVTHEVLITDPIAPTGTPPADVTVDCIDLVPGADALLITDEADNNGVPTVAHLSDVSDGNTCPETITRTYRITDACANFTDVTQTITVHDLIAPTASNPADINVECAADVPAADITVVTDEADNCGTPTVAFVSDVSDNNSCPETITRTYSVTDSCGNSINVTQNIIINDTQAPTATAPAAVNVECVTAVPAADPLAITDEADNCTAAPTVIHLSDVSDGNSCPETITRTYRITDDCGNFTDVTQTITINDITLPTASNPAQTIVPGGPAPAPDPTVVIDEADNCGTPTVAFVSQVSDNNPCPETITYTYSVTDSCGNSINVTHEVLITDPIAPTGTPPADVTVDCIDLVPAADPLLITDEADNNGVPTVTHLSDVSDGNTCPETITRTYRITDACANFTDVTQTITVHDLTAPTASNPADINVQCAADVPAADITVVTDEADNCGTPTVAFVSDVSDNNTCPETITRTYSVTDSCGNSINVTQNIIINDTQAPTATAPAAVNVECIADVPVADPTIITDEADNCTANPTVTHVGDVSDGNTCPEIITRTYSITDDCGNQTTVDQIITVNDVTPPTASNPADIVVPGGPAPAPDPTVVTDEADNCTVNPLVAFVSDVSDNNPCPETITRTYSVTDDCGNQILVNQNIIITDPIAPTGTAPANVAVECIDLVPAADPALIVDEADNNGVPTVTHLSDVSDGNTCPETITRTFRITDPCGNFIDVVQLITVHDLTAPTASNPTDINVQCAADVPAADITVVTDEADNCGTPTVAFVSDVSDNNTCPETITRTYSVTDSCGNSINVTQNIIINDTQAPTATAPAALNVECVADVPAADPTIITDEADNCTANPTVVHVGDVSDGNSCPETITRTYSITDDCGNQITVDQIITINDVTNPTASNPAAINVSCASDVPAPDVTVVTDEADNCGTPTVAFVSDVSDNNSCNGEVITRTYSVTDDCGNTINVTQTINIGAMMPVADAGVDQSVCEGTAVSLNGNSPLGATTSWDNGVLDGVAFNPAVGTTTYTLTADVCGGECVDTDQVNVTVNPTPQILFEGDELLGCEPHTVNFTNLSTAQFDCVWDFGDGNTANDCGPVSNTYDNAGMYDVTLTVTSVDGCTNSDTYTNYVEVTPYPIAAFTYSPSQIDIMDTEVEFMNNSLYADTYTWSFGDLSEQSTEEHPTHIFPEVGDVSYTVTLIAESGAGCIDQESVVIYVADQLVFHVPNIFTPDGNTVNNEFLPIFFSGVDIYDYHLTIFNRWGEVMFESYDVTNGWNGHYGDGGLVQDGVYIWQLEFGETMSDKKHTHRGHVTVLK